MRVIAKTQTKYGQIMLALLLVVGSFMLLTTSVQAAELPTSENPEKGNWTAMKPSSFKVDMTSVIEQCNRAAAASKKDRLTTAMCQKLPTLIQSGRCQKRQVPDGVVFDYMNGSESGQSRVTRNVKKVLGRSDSATICNLGNRTFAYWFTGEEGVSCNNVGIVFTAPPLRPIRPAPPLGQLPPAPPVVIDPPGERTAVPKPPEDCVYVFTGAATTTSVVIESHGQILNTCLGPQLVHGQSVVIGGGTVTTRTCK